MDWNVPDRYEIVRRLGGGRYSEVSGNSDECHLRSRPDIVHGSRSLRRPTLQVFEGIDSSNEDSCVIKVLKPVAKKKIKREIKILRNLAGGPNVIRLMDIVHDPPSRSNSLIMEYVESTDWKELYYTLTDMEIKYYLFQLLRVSTAALLDPLPCMPTAGNRCFSGIRFRPFARNHPQRRKACEYHVRPCTSQGQPRLGEVIAKDNSPFISATSD